MLRGASTAFAALAMVAVLTLAPPFAKGQALEDRLPFVDPSRQYLIQTDQGPERLFRYQTLTGQFRKEKRLEDGSVTGSYGWVDPNGVLRLYDYVSDNLGYRIEKTRLFKVGKSTQERTYRIPSRGAGTFDLGFEVIPLDFESDPNFEVIEGGQLLRSGGQRPDLAASLTNTDTDPRNPIHQQGQATFFDHSAPPPTTTPKPFVIGQAYTQKPSAEPRGLPFVIGAAANGRKVTRPMAEARAALAAVGAAQVDTPTPSTRKRPIVIGLRHDRR